MVVTHNRRTDYSIVVTAQAAAAERYAARELSHFLARMSSAAPAVVTDRRMKTGPEIVLGHGPRAAALGVAPSLTPGAEEYIVRAAAGDLVIAGGSPRGTLYGVYAFLEFCGVRFFANECTAVPNKPDLAVPDDLTLHEKPAFSYREIFYNDAFNGDFAVRLRQNGHHHRLYDEHGGCEAYVPGYFVHTFSRLVPPEKYYDAHPEYFALRDGVRQRDRHPQLCLSNPEIFDIALSQALEDLRKSPGARIISISQNDGSLPCQCEHCQKIVAEEGGEIGPILRFVNRIAEEIEREFPDVWVDTLAYDYSRKPPLYVRPRKNVIIRLCSFECCFSHPLSECREIADTKKKGTDPVFADFAGDVEKWSRIAHSLFIWDYVTDFELYQNIHPNLHVLQDNLRFFRNNNVMGVFSQGNGQSPAGEMAELRAYLLAKLSWNPDFDVAAGRDEFLSAWFGPAAAFMCRYIDLCSEAVLSCGYHLSLYDCPNAPFITKGLLQKASELFDLAEAATAGLPAENRRVRKERLAVRLSAFFVNPPDGNRSDETERFITDAAEFSLMRFSEKWGRENIRRLLNHGVWPPLAEDMTVIRDEL